LRWVGGAVLAVGMALAYALPCWRGRIQQCDGWCSLGSAPACNVLARNYDEGDGTDIRDDLAVGLYTQACDDGYATACVNLGIMYENAEGVAPDKLQAAKLYQRGCPDKLSACRRLASLIADDNVPIAAPTLPSVLERACDGHDDEAMRSCNALARLYDAGRGAPLDDRQAVRLYTRACDGHLGVACFNLSLMYRRGEGVQRDDGRAVELERLACERDNGGHRAPYCQGS
jgi:TPR repeat protein